MTHIISCDICQRADNFRTKKEHQDYVWKSMRLEELSIEDVCEECHKAIVNFILTLANKKE